MYRNNCIKSTEKLFYLYICPVRLHNKHKESPFDKGELKVNIDETYTLSELSKTAMKLYLFVREYAFRTEGRIIFDFNMAKGLCGFKQDKSVYNALNELIAKDIVAASEDSLKYYYNPKFIGKEKE